MEANGKKNTADIFITLANSLDSLERLGFINE